MLQHLPACVPADRRGWEGWKGTCFCFALFPAQQLISRQLFHRTVSAVLCLCFLLWPCCKCRKDGTTWKVPCGMYGDHFSKSACDAPDSAYLQGGSSNNLHNLGPSEIRSYWTGCLLFCNEGKILIPNSLTSWAQTQQ